MPGHLPQLRPARPVSRRACAVSVEMGTRTVPAGGSADRCGIQATRISKVASLGYSSSSRQTRRPVPLLPSPQASDVVNHALTASRGEPQTPSAAGNLPGNSCSVAATEDSLQVTYAQGHSGAFISQVQALHTLHVLCSEQRGQQTKHPRYGKDLGGRGEASSAELQWESEER